MEEVENTNLDTDQIPDEIIIFPPDDGEVTDEDSGEEDNVVINNLPGAQLRTLAEVVLPNIEDVSDVDSEDDLPLSRLVKRQQVSRPKKKQTELAWIKTDITPKMPSWIPPYGPKQQISPVESFFQFFDDDVIDMLVTYNNLNYHIFFDNLFTSLPLLLELKSRGLKGTGTIRENRLPKSCPIKSADKLRKEQRGSLDFASSVNNELTSRYDGMDHIMVVYQDKQTRCASCHKKCNFLCQKCDIALHPKQCFLLYHTK
nr:unnamed protein product [Callosobruchus chinensis]